MVPFSGHVIAVVAKNDYIYLVQESCWDDQCLRLT